MVLLYLWGSTPPNLNVLNSTCKFPLPFYDFLRNKARSTEQSTDKVINKTWRVRAFRGCCIHSVNTLADNKKYWGSFGGVSLNWILEVNLLFLTKIALCIVPKWKAWLRFGICWSRLFGNSNCWLVLITGQIFNVCAVMAWLKVHVSFKIVKFVRRYYRRKSGYNYIRSGNPKNVQGSLRLSENHQNKNWQAEKKINKQKEKCHRQRN